MNEKQRIEYAEQLKLSAKEFIDGISADTELGQRVKSLSFLFLVLIYAVAYVIFMPWQKRR